MLLPAAVRQGTLLWTKGYPMDKRAILWTKETSPLLRKYGKIRKKEQKKGKNTVRTLSERTAGFTDSVIRRMTRVSIQYGAVNLS